MQRRKPSDSDKLAPGFAHTRRGTLGGARAPGAQSARAEGAAASFSAQERLSGPRGWTTGQRSMCPSAPLSPFRPAPRPPPFGPKGARRAPPSAPPSCCFSPGWPRDASLRKPRHRPSFRPDRFQPAAARRRAAAPWRPAGAGRARPCAIPAAVPRTSAGAAARPALLGPPASPAVFSTVTYIFTRSSHVKSSHTCIEGFWVRGAWCFWSFKQERPPTPDLGVKVPGPQGGAGGAGQGHLPPFYLPSQFIACLP